MTSSLLAPPLSGAQFPRVSSIPPRSSTLGAEVAEFSADIGLVLDPWQRHSVDVIHGVRTDGKWSAFEVGELVARQNGKGGVLEATELAGLFLLGDRLILHSAHEFKTAAEAFLRVKALIDASDELTRLVARIRTSHGDEGVELRSGARLRFVARSRSSGRGFSGDRIILDEAQELPLAAMGALLPTLSARPNPQVIYTGTVPAPENDAEHWTSVRDRGRRGTDPSLAWLEWSPDPPAEGEEYDLDDRAAWVESNPALGIRITEETISRERNSLDAAQFARERLSIWETLGVQNVIDPKAWAAAAVGPESQVVGPYVFAVDVSPDRAHASVGMASVRPDGVAQVETTRNDRGTGWVLDYLRERHAKWAAMIVVDAAGPAGSLISPLRQLGIEPLLTSARDMGHACGAFHDGITQGKVRQMRSDPLDRAVDGARKRPLGDAWAWHRRDPALDITPLVAVTLALHGLSVKLAEPPEKPPSKAFGF